jgi:hypothetical protein
MFRSQLITIRISVSLPYYSIIRNPATSPPWFYDFPRGDYHSQWHWRIEVEIIFERS